jgi:hypothetical protein
MVKYVSLCKCLEKMKEKIMCMVKLTYQHTNKHQSRSEFFPPFKVLITKSFSFQDTTSCKTNKQYPKEKSMEVEHILD